MKHAVGDIVITSHGDIDTVRSIDGQLVGLLDHGIFNENYLFRTPFEWLAYRNEEILKRALEINERLIKFKTERGIDDE